MRRNQINKFLRFSIDRQLLAGVRAHVGDDLFLVVDGKKLGAAEIAQVLQERIDATARVDAKKAEYQHAVREERATLARTKDPLEAICMGLLVMFRSSAGVLAALGLAP